MTKKPYAPDKELYARVKKMLLLGFSNIEMIPSLERAFNGKFGLTDVDECVDYIHGEWSELPDAEKLKRSESELWEMSDMFKSDILNLYQRMHQNALATLDGEFSHKDGTPVITTKPGEVVSIAEKILKLQRDAVDTKRNVIRLLGAASSYDTPQTHSRFELDESELYEEDIKPPERTKLV